jgi:hypothetical protein
MGPSASRRGQARNGDFTEIATTEMGDAAFSLCQRPRRGPEPLAPGREATPGGSGVGQHTMRTDSATPEGSQHQRTSRGAIFPQSRGPATTRRCATNSIQVFRIIFDPGPSEHCDRLFAE